MQAIKRFIQIDDAQSIEQVRDIVTDYVDKYHGRVVSTLSEAEDILQGEDDMREARYGESVRANITTADGDEIYVRVTEVYIDGGSADYCYMVDVDYQ